MIDQDEHETGECRGVEVDPLPALVAGGPADAGERLRAPGAEVEQRGHEGHDPERGQALAEVVADPERAEHHERR